MHASLQFCHKLRGLLRTWRLRSGLEFDGTLPELFVCNCEEDYSIRIMQVLMSGSQAFDAMFCVLSLERSVQAGM